MARGAQDEVGPDQEASHSRRGAARLWVGLGDLKVSDNHIPSCHLDFLMQKLGQGVEGRKSNLDLMTPRSSSFSEWLTAPAPELKD